MPRQVRVSCFSAKYRMQDFKLAVMLTCMLMDALSDMRKPDPAERIHMRIKKCTDTHAQ